MFTDPSGLSGVNPMLQWIARQLIENPEFREATVVILEHVGTAALDSSSVSISHGFGVGGKLGAGANQGTFVLRVSEFTHTFSTSEIEQSYRIGLEVSKDFVDQIRLGGGVSLSSSIDTMMEYGLVFAPDRNFDYFVGALGPNNTQLAFTNMQMGPDVVASVGISGYFVVGGGVSASFNASEFWRRVNSPIVRQ